MMLLNIAFQVIMAEGNFKSFFFLMITKRLAAVLSLEFLLQQCLLVLKGFVQDLLHSHLKDVKNNHNTLLALNFLFISISFKVTLS